ncbi:MAG: FxLYD domain-containing protein [Bryobacteraceae bacterium]
MSSEKSWWAALNDRFDRFLSGTAPSDPLYVSNRSAQQKLRRAAAIVVPVLIVVGVIVAGSIKLFRANVNPYEHLAETPAPAPQPAPALRPDPASTPAGLEVLTIRIYRDSGPPVISGVVRNNTGKAVSSAMVTYFLADSGGSMIATENATVHDVPPRGSVTFRAPLRTQNAAMVMVREVRAE